MAYNAAFTNTPGTGQVTSPFKTLTRSLFPRTMKDILSWGEELWLHHGIYSQAIKKAVRYFMTELEIEGDADLSYDTRKNYRDVIQNNYDIMTELSTIGDDYIAFGNSFTSLYIPFIRNIVCPDCGFRFPFEKGREFVQWKEFKFVGTCPNATCNFKGQFKRKDLRKPEEELKPTIIRWPPQYMRIKHHPISGKSKYYLEVTKYTELIEGLESGDSVFVNETPWEIIEALRDSKHFEFDDDEIYHMRNPIIAYTNPEMRGWGLPKFMSEFETAVLIVLLDKYNESIITDYLMPFRVIAPPQTGSGANGNSADPMLNVSLGNFVSKAKQMLNAHRKNPTGWNFFPFPLEYQILGGEAKDLTPVDLMEHFESRLLNSMGIPQEFYTGTVTDSAGPIIGFKMFERTWQHFTKELDRWLDWFTNKQGTLMQWEKVTATLVPVSIYEDPEIRQLKLDLAASKQISRTTAFRSLGIDVEYEDKRIEEEEDEYNKRMEEKQIKDAEKQNVLGATYAPSAAEEMLQQQEQAAAAQQGGAAPAPAPGGAGAGAGAGPPSLGGSVDQGAGSGGSLDEIMNQADQIAQQLLTMEPSQRKSELINLKKTNEALHAQVKARLETLEQQAAQTGVQLTRAGELPPPGQG